MKAKGEFSVAQWDETPLDRFPASAPASKASIVYEARGEINGKFIVEYLLQYTSVDKAEPHNAKATYVGFMFFEGSIGGKCGTFVAKENGKYENFCPSSELTIKDGSGTGDFCGISGTGNYKADGGKMIITFDYTISA